MRVRHAEPARDRAPARRRVPMGGGPRDGIVDEFGEAFGHPSLYVVDGATIPGLRPVIWDGLVGVFVGDAGAVEGGDLGEDAGGRLDDGHGENPAGALAEPHAQVEQGRQLQRGQGGGRAGLD